MIRSLGWSVAIAMLASVVAADTPALVPMWRTGTLHEGFYSSQRIVAADVTGDGVRDIVGCTRGAPYAMSKRPSLAVYDVAWYGPPSDCKAVAAADLDGDGGAEIIVVSNPESSIDKLRIFNTESLGHARTEITLPDSIASVTDVVVANVDADANLEIVVTTENDTFVYDAATLSLQWTAAYRGGTGVAVGDLEGDGKNEIIV
ncbi:MAG TPA: VCBS repeat-containing protein, partial [Thermoanaerobaculia bacterium]|nr:VCBS repeat-containing protein [Thermoanaerobaculia bacterium]